MDRLQRVIVCFHHLPRWLPTSTKVLLRCSVWIAIETRLLRGFNLATLLLAMSIGSRRRTGDNNGVR
jgi:hypothetical protein